MTWPVKWVRKQAKMTTTPPSSKQSKGLSPELVNRLNNLSPADRSKVVETASKLLAIRAKREAEATDGKIDLTQPKG